MRAPQPEWVPTSSKFCGCDAGRCSLAAAIDVEAKAMATPTLLVTHEAGTGIRSVIEATIGAAACVVYLSDIPSDDRAAALTKADVVMARDTSKELQPGEAALMRNARLIQFITAGVDYI